MPSNLDIYMLDARGQKELIDFVASKAVLEFLNIDYEKHKDVILNAVKKLFIDDAIKNKFEKFYFLFKPMSLIAIQREIKLYFDKKRDEFNKNELMHMLYTYAVIVLFLIIRDQNDFYKDYIDRLGKKVVRVSEKFHSYLKDSNKIYTPVLSTIEETPNCNTPDITCFSDLEEAIYRMS